MKHFFRSQTIAFCRCDNYGTSEGLDLPISDGHDIIDIDALEAAVAQGDAEAQCRLAECLYSGRYVKRVKGIKDGIETIPRNVNRAFLSWSKAAEQGNTLAKYYLGYCYWHSKGTAENKNKAFNLFRCVAEQGDAEAQFYLGCCYWDGDGTEKNRDEAAKWFYLAAKQGQCDAINFVKHHEIEPPTLE